MMTSVKTDSLVAPPFSSATTQPLPAIKALPLSPSSMRSNNLSPPRRTSTSPFTSRTSPPSGAAAPTTITATTTSPPAPPLIWKAVRLQKTNSGDSNQNSGVGLFGAGAVSLGPSSSSSHLIQGPPSSSEGLLRPAPPPTRQERAMDSPTAAASQRPVSSSIRSRVSSASIPRTQQKTTNRGDTFSKAIYGVATQYEGVVALQTEKLADVIRPTTASSPKASLSSASVASPLSPGPPTTTAGSSSSSPMPRVVTSPARSRFSSSARARGASGKGAAMSPPGQPHRPLESDDIVTQVVALQHNVPVASHVMRRLVPYERQGNRDYYTEENMRKRAALKLHPLVVQAAQTMWDAMPKTTSGTFLNEPMYRWMHKKLYFAFAANATEEQWAPIADEDWAADRGTEEQDGLLTKAQFCDVIFSWADIWCQTLDAVEYEQFLLECSTVIIREGTRYDGPRTEMPSRLSKKLKSQANMILAARGMANLGMAVAMTARPPPTRMPASPARRSSVLKPTTAVLQVDSDKTLGDAEDAPLSKQDRKAMMKKHAEEGTTLIANCAVAVDEFVQAGIAEVDQTEVRQLHGLVRLMCDMEDREEAELLRLDNWITEFFEDYIASLANEVTDTKTIADMATFRAKLRQQQTQLSEMRESEDLDRRQILELLARLLEATTETSRELLQQRIFDVKQRVSFHWTTAQRERQAFRVEIRSVIAELQSIFSEFYEQRRKKMTTTNGAGSSSQPASPSNAASSFAAAVEGDADLLCVLERELAEIERHTTTDVARATESISLFEFVTKQIATVKPILKLLEVALVNIRNSATTTGGSQSDLELGAHEWRQHVTSIGKIEVGVFYVTDSLHQQMQTSLAGVIDTAEQNLTVLFDVNRLKMEHVEEYPSLLAKLKEEAEKQHAAHKASVSKTMSDMRLKLNKFFSQMCTEEKKMLSTSTNEAAVRFAIRARMPLLPPSAAAAASSSHHSPNLHFSLLQSAVSPSVLSEGSTGSIRSPLSNEDSLNNNNNHHSAPSPSPPGPPITSRDPDPSWFTVIPNGHAEPTTFVAAKFLTFLQHMTLEFSCQYLSDLLELFCHVLLTLHDTRQANEEHMRELLVELEQSARSRVIHNISQVKKSMFPLDRKSMKERSAVNASLAAATTTSIHTTVKQMIQAPQTDVVVNHQYFSSKAEEWRGKKQVVVQQLKDMAKPGVMEQLRARAKQRASIVGTDESEFQEGIVASTDALTAVDSHKTDRHRRHSEAFAEEVGRIERAQGRREEEVEVHKRVSAMRDREQEALSLGKLHQHFVQLHEKIKSGREQLEKLKSDTVEKDVVFLKSCTMDILGLKLAEAESSKSRNKRKTTTTPSTLLGVAALNSSDSTEPTLGNLSGTPPTSSSVTPIRRSPQTSAGFRRSPGRDTGAMSATTTTTKVASVRGDAAFERRKATYLRNRSSDVDILIQECVKRSMKVPNSVRAALSSRPGHHDTRVFAMSFSPELKSALVPLLGDLMLLNPLEQLCLQQCSLTEEDLLQLSGVLQGHPTLRFVDLRNNQNLNSTACAVAIANLVRSCKKLIFVATQGIGWSEPQQEEIAGLCSQNAFFDTNVEEGELKLFAAHFMMLGDRSSGYLTLQSVEIARRAAKGAGGGDPSSSASASPSLTHRPSSSAAAGGGGGVDLTIQAAVQGLIGTYAVTHMKRHERWAPIEIVKRFFPSLSRGGQLDTVDKWQTYL